MDRNKMGEASGMHADTRCKKDLGGKREGKNNLEDLRTDGRIILKWIFKNLHVCTVYQ